MLADHTTPCVLAVIGLTTVIRTAFVLVQALDAVLLLALIIWAEIAAALASGAETIVKVVLAVAIIPVSGYRLVESTQSELKNYRLGSLFGIGAGVHGEAYGKYGPSLLAYGAFRRWSSEWFRATRRGYFLPASRVVMAGYRATGLRVPVVTRYYLATFPVAQAATDLGRS